MCGIAGFSAKKELNNIFLEKSIKRLKHRGPDADGYFLTKNKKVGLAHTRLAIQDLSPKGNQPLLSEDGNNLLLFNGEIYNQYEIKNELQKKGFDFKSHCDTEVLLNLLISSKKDIKSVGDMLTSLNGIFALAFFDIEEDTLFLARDNFGVKPLYYQITEEAIYFGSETKIFIDQIKLK